MTLRPFQSEAETTDDLEVKAQRQREVSHKMCLSNPLGSPPVCQAEESQWLHVARLWASSLAIRAHLPFIMDFRNKKEREEKNTCYL